jgi:hypothetical protein
MLNRFKRFAPTAADLWAPHQSLPRVNYDERITAKESEIWVLPRRVVAAFPFHGISPET